MKFNSEESINVLKYALQKEKTAEDFYREKSRTIDISPARDIFNDLASDEHRHFEMVRDLLNQAESGAETSKVTLPPSPDPKSRVEAVFSKFKSGQSPLLSSRTTAMEALSFALEIRNKVSIIIQTPP
ncbi:MAG: ferritin family protein [Candidatus Latescibacterota bacterium]